MIPPLPFSLTPAQQQRADELLKRAEAESLDLDELASEENDKAVKIELQRINAERHPDTIRILKEYGASVGNLGHHRQALEIFGRCFTLDGSDFHALIQYLHALYFLQRYEDILREVENAPKAEEAEDRAQLLYWKTNALLDLGRYEEALEPGEDAFYLWRDNHWMTFSLGYAHYELGHYEEAIRYYNETIKLKPDFRTPYLNKACMYSLLGKYQESYLCLMQIYDLDKAYFKTIPEDDELDGVLNSEYGPELRRLIESIPGEGRDDEPDLRDEISY